MEYITEFQKNQITGLLAKIGISLFTDSYNGDKLKSEAGYEIVELIKDIIVKINSNEIPVAYYDIVNGIINKFRQDDSCGMPVRMFNVIDDILTISQMHSDIIKKEKSIAISAPKLSEQDSKRIFEELKKHLREASFEYCVDFESPVKPENLEKKHEEGNDSIPEERFAKIVDRLYGMVHKVVFNSEALSNKTERTFPDAKISEYAAIFGL